MKQEEVIEKLEQHEKRIGNLEVGHAKLEIHVTNLVSEMSGLNGTIKTFMYGAIGCGVGFIVLYIQNH